MSNDLRYWAKTFESFLYLEPIFEASTLSKTGMPKAMITAIHKKLEHWEGYPRMAHTYRGRTPVPMPFKYHRPAHDIEIPEPKVFTGKKSNVSPFSGRALSRPTSAYRDFEWYLENIKLEQNRILITNPELDFYLFIYDKSRSKGATGLQYAVLAWDKDKKKAVDFGYSELTTREVDLSKIRQAHDTKGGNTAMKLMEFIRASTRESGEKDYAPSSTKPLYVYEIGVDATGKEEPRELRKTRAELRTQVNSLAVIDVFADRYLNILPKIKKPALEKMAAQIMGEYVYQDNPSEAVVKLAQKLGVDPHKFGGYLFYKMRDFRRDIFNEGRAGMGEGVSAYSKTSGFDLEAENKIADSFRTGSYKSKYYVSAKYFSPEEEVYAAQGNRPEEEDAGYREASPEKSKRSLPTPGDYASIQSIIKKHTLDGFLSKFAWYLVTDEIKFPDVSIGALLGLSAEEMKGMEDDDWIS